MLKTYIGDTSLAVSELIYGNWLTHPRLPDEAVAMETICAALDAGITTFDTCDNADGTAEDLMRRVLKHERRDSLEIFTRVYWPGDRLRRPDRGLSGAQIQASIDESLTRLGTDYVDVYQAHRFDVDTPLEETMRAFAEVVRVGKARFIGVSEWNAEQLRAGHVMADDLGIRLVSNLALYSPLWRAIEPEVLPATRELGIAQIAWAPPFEDAPDATGEEFDNEPSDQGRDIPGLAELHASLRALRRASGALGVGPEQVAQAWTLHHEDVAGVVIGAVQPEQLHANLEIIRLAHDSAAINLITAELARG
ncbi:aldo/keto reductase [Mycetocola saprophilus]|uniref:aldo/keto reductase n=1 Tax=Mycetocola saprophilus TaxID=76636 RepID=UPI003BF200D5